MSPADSERTGSRACATTTQSAARFWQTAASPAPWCLITTAGQHIEKRAEGRKNRFTICLYSEDIAALPPAFTHTPGSILTLFPEPRAHAQTIWRCGFTEELVGEYRNAIHSQKRRVFVFSSEPLPSIPPGTSFSCPPHQCQIKIKAARFVPIVS